MWRISSARRCGQTATVSKRGWLALSCSSALSALVIAVLAFHPNTAPPPATSILFVGDSLTLGIAAVNPQHDYEALLLDRIRKLRPLDWAETVIEHPYGLVDNAELRAAPYLAGHPQLIVLEVGTHDVQAPPAQKALFAQRYAHLLDHLAESHAKIIVATLPWLGYAPDGEDYQQALRFNQIIRQDAAARGDPVVDLWRPTVGDYAILSTPADSTFEPPYRGDYFHPGDFGHQVLANAFWPVLHRVEQQNAQQQPSVRVPFTMPASALGLSDRDEPR